MAGQRGRGCETGWQEEAWRKNPEEEKAEAGGERGRGGTDSSGWETGARVLDPAPGFFLISVPGLLGSPSPRVPTSAEPGWPLGLCLASAHLPFGPGIRMWQREAHPSFCKESEEDGKAEIKCMGGEGKGCIRQGRRARAAALTTLPRGQARGYKEFGGLAPLIRSGPGSRLGNRALSLWHGPAGALPPSPPSPPASLSNDPPPFSTATTGSSPALERCLPHLGGRSSRGECKKQVAVAQQRPRRRSKKHLLWSFGTS